MDPEQADRVGLATFTTGFVLVTLFAPWRAGGATVIEAVAGDLPTLVIGSVAAIGLILAASGWQIWKTQGTGGDR